MINNYVLYFCLGILVAPLLLMSTPLNIFVKLYFPSYSLTKQKHWEIKFHSLSLNFCCWSQNHIKNLIDSRVGKIKERGGVDFLHIWFAFVNLGCHISCACQIEREPVNHLKNFQWRWTKQLCQYLQISGTIHLFYPFCCRFVNSIPAL